MTTAFDEFYHDTRVLLDEHNDAELEELVQTFRNEPCLNHRVALGTIHTSIGRAIYRSCTSYDRSDRYMAATWLYLWSVRLEVRLHLKGLCLFEELLS